MRQEDISNIRLSHYVEICQISESWIFSNQEMVNMIVTRYQTPINYTICILFYVLKERKKRSWLKLNQVWIVNQCVINCKSVTTMEGLHKGKRIRSPYASVKLANLYYLCTKANINIKAVWQLDWNYCPTCYTYN